MSTPATTATFATLVAAFGFATPATADLWWTETLYGRSITTFMPPGIDGTPAPTIVAIHDSEADSRVFADAFPIYSTARAKGRKIVYFGHADPDELARAQNPDTAKFLAKAAGGLLSEDIARPDGIFMLGWGRVFGDILDFACDNPGILAGVIGVGYDSLDFDCADPGSLNALVIHRGVEQGPVTGGAPGPTPTEAVEREIRKLRDAGAEIDSIPLEGRRFEYPGIRAQFRDQTDGAGIAELVDYFVDVSLDED